MGTGAFGVGVTQSNAGTEKLERLAELNAKELDQTQEREVLRALLPSKAAFNGS